MWAAGCMAELVAAYETCPCLSCETGSSVLLAGAVLAVGLEHASWCAGTLQYRPGLGWASLYVDYKS